MKNIVILTGAGISAESGINTFRDSNGLWEGHDIMEVASPIGWTKNPKLVLDFYNKRRAQLTTVKPNVAHKALKELEKNFTVHIITQNVDDLHERAGSSSILHLHGELIKVRSTKDVSLIYEWRKDLVLGDLAEDHAQLRPHIVWFGEDVPLIPKAIQLVEQADIVLIIGTSLQVYPAASLMHYAKPTIPIYYIDPKANQIDGLPSNIICIPELATVGMKKIMNLLTSN
ncbi:NAD-dependent protein deacylase [Flavobacteriaceae bacterium UJ101]|nr:NAD-dependent protein deacylase [Flavobacteriaceae bacterium UJ101]